MRQVNICPAAFGPRLYRHAGHFRIHRFDADPDRALIDFTLDGFDRVGLGMKDALADQRAVEFDDVFRSVVNLVQRPFIMALD